MHNGMFGFHGFGWLIALVLIGLLIFFLIRYLNVGNKEQKESALEILKKRYAAGELTDSDFEKMKKKLE